MQPEQAGFLRDFYLKAIEGERATTRKVIAAVPEEKHAYTPHPTSRTAFDLAWHIASAHAWFLDSIAKREFSMDSDERPEGIRTVADIVAFYEKQGAEALEKVKKVTSEQMAEIVDFFGMKFPLAIYLNFLLLHEVHHRGQLSVYLRPMGAKVPDIYGGSADEPFQMAAEQS